MNPNTCVVETSETLVVLSTICVECRSHGFSLTVKKDAFTRWLAGALPVQEAFPGGSADDRELFFQSGICGACWDIIFGED